eukprot:TRINITY_DN33104_c0_g1_i1.p1 TRINITY_DN33104_c0_g1~~TRINITY_DN33104_c0_g1_i1.p1  ORF type:complete len:109 (+),score=16.53 TRINITY_DN33104_c0_g1_i1:50-376(+)
MSFQDDLESDASLALPPNACARVQTLACEEAYLLTEKSCAPDSVGRQVWEGKQRGHCVRCQQLVEAYRRLRARCPLIEDWRSSLEALAESLTEESQDLGRVRSRAAEL